MASKKHLSRMYSGGVIHNSVHACTLSPRSINQLRWSSKGIDPVGDHALLCAQDKVEYLYEVECIAPGVITARGMHAPSVLSIVRPTLDVNDFTHPELNRVKYSMDDAELVLTLNAGRATFHRRLHALVSYRLPRASLDAILEGRAIDVDWNDPSNNMVITHVLRLINGNPYNIYSDVGVNRQACLTYLYFGHVVDVIALAE